MNCAICHKPIKLFPSATYRANMFGGEPSDYTKLFTVHAQCQIDKRNQETLDLIQRHYAKPLAIDGRGNLIDPDKGAAYTFPSRKI